MANKKFNNAKDQQISDALNITFDAMKEKGYEPYNQLSGYILSDDEHYLTTYNNARQLMTACDHEEILKFLLKYFFEN